MKQMLAAGLCVLLCLVLVPTAGAVGTSASCAVLMERESGRILYQQAPHEPRLIASITKLMTALTALESGCPLDKSFPVPKEAVGVEGSSLYLKEGERLTLRDLLYGALLKSGNDAATAIAIHCGGSVSAFVERMNQKAGDLGMKHTHFANPTGLNAEDHFSTAYDMALLARACLANPVLAEMVSTRSITIGGRVLTNHNKLLGRCPGCIGLKTGYTEKAGRTLVSAAERKGVTLIAVTLNDPDDWRDHEALFDWGFQQYSMTRAVQTGDSWGRLPVNGSLAPFAQAVAAEDFSWPLADAEQLELFPRWDAEQLTAPVQKGQKLGVLSVRLGQETVGEVPLVAKSTVQRVVIPRRWSPEQLLRGFWR